MQRTKGTGKVTSAKEIAQVLGGEEKSPGQYMALCPAHNDKNPSLSINQNGDQVLLNCFAGCEYREIKEALEDKGISLGSNKEFAKSLGLPDGILPTFNQKKYAAHWAYRNRSGEIMGYVVRYESGAGEKDIIPYFKKDDKGRWKSGYNPELKKDASRPLYNLDKLAQIEPGEERIWVVEGEKVADALTRLGLVATTSPGGSQAPKKTDWSPLAYHSITIWPDKDQAGKTFAANAFRMILESGDTRESDLDIDAVDVDKLALEEKEDGFDWIEKGHGEEDILSIPTTPIVDVSDLGIVEYIPSEIYKTINQMEQLLLQKAPYEIFQRSDMLVRIRPTFYKKMMEDDQEGVEFTLITKEWLRDKLNQKLSFVQNTKEGYKPIDTPSLVAMRYKERSGEWRLHHLSGLIHAPTLKPNGEPIERPGFDENSGIYVNTSGAKFKPIKKDASREDAEKALKVLQKPFVDFPFVKDEDKSVVLAAILTALVRKSVPLAPMFGFTAPVAGSGKTKLANIVSIIATGKYAGATSLGNDREEERKNLYAELLQGDPIVLLDQIERPINSGVLTEILTSPYFRDRILGVSEKKDVETSVTFLATGNNLTVQGDLVRRVLLCTIDPGVEKPDQRSGFKISNVEHYVQRNRAKLVQAGLHILKAYIREGKPKQNIPQYGSYEEWSDWVRSALVWAGCADPNLTRKKIEREDPVKMNLSRIVNLWKELYGIDVSVRVSEIMSDCNEALDSKNKDKKGKDDENAFELAQAFLEVTRSRGKQLDGSKIGSWLHSNQGKYQDGYKIIKNPHSPKGAGAEWMLTS